MLTYFLRNLIFQMIKLIPKLSYLKKNKNKMIKILMNKLNLKILKKFKRKKQIKKSLIKKVLVTNLRRRSKPINP